MARRAAADLSGMGDWVRHLGEQIGNELGRVIAENVQRHLDSAIDVGAMAKRLTGGGGKRGRRSSGGGDKSSCGEPGCNNPVLAKGLCRSHYYRARYQTQKGGASRGKRAAKGDAGASSTKKKRGRKAAKAPADAAPQGETGAV